MYINWFTWIIYIDDHICYIKKWGEREFSVFSQRNGKLPLPQWKQGNYLVIPIYAWWHIWVFASPTPKPSTTIRTGRGGGGENLHTGRWKGHQEKGIALVVSQRVVILMEGQQVTRRCWRWTVNYTEKSWEEEIIIKEKEYGQNSLEDKEPGWILGGGVRGDQKHRWQEIIVN